MKKTMLAFVVIIFALSMMITSCKKDKSDPVIVPQKDAWAVGQVDSTGYGLLLHSADLGETWERRAGNFEAIKDVNLENLCVLSQDEVWVIGGNQTIIYTTDRGLSWQKSQLPQLAENIEFYGISSADNTNIWVSATNGTMLHTSNKGSSWEIYTLPFAESGMLQGIKAITSQMVISVGGKENNKSIMEGVIAMTKDGGTTWLEVELPDNYNINEWIGVSNFGTENIVIYGSKGHYSFSIDGGNSWKNDSVIVGTGTGAADINCLTMLSENSWWAALDFDHTLFTSDQGKTWTDQGSAGPSNMFLLGIDYYNTQTALIAGSSAGWPPSGKIIKTSDSGNSWELKYYSSTAPISKVSFIN
ncbi:MAG: hypothetical protein KJ578_04795 [Bacteroidetes bacterium]|nr:hypothetical protein [Bacteroidota bacterium]MBU1580342.1 hypothetical protein [Bacteroidota bacterium]MBU2466779.1 hypothetical protein [Bacteroidota bacterium]MBU2557081.1 hypothetical protein [Bacteroidota bacterium]